MCMYGGKRHIWKCTIAAVRAMPVIKALERKCSWLQSQKQTCTIWNVFKTRRFRTSMKDEQRHLQHELNRTRNKYAQQRRHIKAGACVSADQKQTKQTKERRERAVIMHRLMGCNGGHTYRWSRPAVSPVTLLYDGSGAKLHFGRDSLEGDKQTWHL